jgi:hypothetical protein
VAGGGAVIAAIAERGRRGMCGSSVSAMRGRSTTWSLFDYETVLSESGLYAIGSRAELL